MGYSEILCHICGISFNIARIRKPDEPRSAAWVYYGEDFVDVEGTLSECGRDAGCMMVDRHLDEDDFREPWARERSAGDEEPLESGNEEFAPNAEEDDDEDEPDLDGLDDVMRIEHIAGPKCKSTNGFSGYRLSLEEMKHSRVWQCLVRKTDAVGWKPAADDEAFECEEDFFLSGLMDGLPDIEMASNINVFPARHGVEDPDATNSMMDGSEEESCMPFHPWCLEIFKRASQATTGKVDMAGLWGWYEREADYDTFHGFPRDGPTKELQQQWWDHRQGTEWIVCNPLYLPDLSTALEPAIATDSSFYPGKGAFDIPPTQPPTISTTTDPFDLLPTELNLQILHILSSKDIASLRLTSRAFRQLPISLWHHLLQKEMPWF